MQQPMFAVPIPILLALGFLIGFVFLILGYREGSDLTRRNHLLGLGIVIIGIMIPATPLSWYGYLMVTSALVLDIIEIAIIIVALIIGIFLIYTGAKKYAAIQ
ncbi:MAG: hypothetical protein ACFFAZ_04175 [Promethearchaeota archaeon]